MKSTADKLYCCYSLNLRNYLYENGLKYELAALNPNSQKLFWIYSYGRLYFKRGIKFWIPNHILHLYNGASSQSCGQEHDRH